MNEEILMKTSRYTEPQILAILKQAKGGFPVAELCRQHGMSNASFYKWCSKYGGMDGSMMSQKKALENENRRLERMVCRPVDVKRIAQGGSWKKMTRPCERRQMAGTAVAKHKVSIALACRAFAVSETCFCYDPKLHCENERIADLLIELTNAKKAWGIGLCFLYQRNLKGHP
jgi:putative transposase